MEFKKTNETEHEVVLSKEEIESAVRQFIVTSKPEYSKDWIVIPKIKDETCKTYLKKLN